jgi:hypothetical protein
MALDFTEYARSYGGQGQQQLQAAQQIGTGLRSAFSKIPGVEDRVRKAKSDALDEAFLPLAQFGAADPSQWGNLTDLPSVENAGSAYMSWKESLSPRQARVAKRKGLLNPMTFKQEYDARMNMYMPGILSQLEGYKRFNHKTDEEMRELMSKYPHLNRFIDANLSEEQKAMYGYMVPEQTWKQWWEGKGGGLGVGAKLAGAGFIGGFGATGMTGLRGGANLYDRFKSPTGLSQRDMTALRGAAKDAKFGEMAVRRSTAARTKKVGTAKSILSKANTKYSKAAKAYKGKKFSATKQGKAIQATINTAKANVTAAKKSPIKSVRGVLDKAIKKHGKGKVIRMMAKRMGMKGAAGLLAKTGLAAIPGGQVIGGALLLNDIRMVYNILSDLAE